MVSYEARCFLMLLKAMLSSGNITEAALVELAYKVAEGRHLKPETREAR